MHVKRVMILNDIYVYYGMALIRHNGQSLIDLEGMEVKLISQNLKEYWLGMDWGLQHRRSGPFQHERDVFCAICRMHCPLLYMLTLQIYV